MIWALMALLTFAVLLAFLEALRRAKARGPWRLGLAVVLPLFFLGFYLRAGEGQCDDLSSPFLLGDLEAARDELKWRLRSCGGTQARWNALLQIEAQLEVQAAEVQEELL